MTAKPSAAMAAEGSVASSVSAGAEPDDQTRADHADHAHGDADRHLRDDQNKHEGKADQAGCQGIGNQFSCAPSRPIGQRTTGSRAGVSPKTTAFSQDQTT